MPEAHGESRDLPLPVLFLDAEARSFSPGAGFTRLDRVGMSFRAGQSLSMTIRIARSLVASLFVTTP